MTRLFYKDPLKAAFIAKKFGVQFDSGDSLKSAIEVADLETTSIPFYIHPDSHETFEKMDKETKTALWTLGLLPEEEK